MTRTLKSPVEIDSSIARGPSMDAEGLDGRNFIGVNIRIIYTPSVYDFFYKKILRKFLQIFFTINFSEKLKFEVFGILRPETH